MKLLKLAFLLVFLNFSTSFSSYDETMEIEGVLRPVSLAKAFIVSTYELVASSFSTIEAKEVEWTGCESITTRVTVGCLTGLTISFIVCETVTGGKYSIKPFFNKAKSFPLFVWDKCIGRNQMNTNNS